MAVEEVRRFGQKPSVALLSHSSFGSSDAPSAQKMRDALELILQRMPDLAVEGEMHADAALSTEIRDREFPDSRLVADANLLIMPNIDAANITYNALRVIAGRGHRGRWLPARSGEAGAYPGADLDGAAHRQHDRRRRRRSGRAALAGATPGRA